MKRVLLLLLAASVSAPALAQHGGHGGHAPARPQARPAPAPAQTRQAPQRRQTRQAPARRQARQAPARAQVRRAPQRPAQPTRDPHAGHGASAQPEAAGPAAAAPSQPDPHAGHGTAAPAQPDPHAGHGTAAPSQPDPHAGHDMSGQQADPHAGHQAEAPAPPVGPPPPAALLGPDHAADAVFGAGNMAAAREELRATHGNIRSYRFSIDQLEYSLRDGRDGIGWEDVQFWYGGDIDRLWIKSAGEATFGEGVESAEVQALWSRAIDPWFNLQAGLRYDFRPRPDRAYLVLGVQGLAPYWFEIDAALFLSERGDLSARFEGEYDLRITQRLILQPRGEFDLALQDDPAIGIGSGLSTAEAGVRLRYEVVPEFAPYVGVEYERAFGDTANFRRVAGEDVGGWRLLFGVRAWF